MTSMTKAIAVLVFVTMSACADEQAQWEAALVDDVCLCETQECVVEWVEQNLGCGLCATLVCEERNWSACVVCPPAGELLREAPERVELRFAW